MVGALARSMYYEVTVWASRDDRDAQVADMLQLNDMCLVMAVDGPYAFILTRSSGFGWTKHEYLRRCM